MRLKHKAINALLGIPLDVVCILAMAQPSKTLPWIMEEPMDVGVVLSASVSRPHTPEEAAKAAVDDGLALARAIRDKVREKMAIRERVRESFAKASPGWKEVFRRARERDEAEWRERARASHENMSPEWKAAYELVREMDESSEAVKKEPNEVERAKAWFANMPEPWKSAYEKMKARRAGGKPS